jgi:N-acetylneuraminate synthase
MIAINGRSIGPGRPVYIIAEMSANHRQDFDRAVALVCAAKQAGADAIKLQTYTPDTMTIRSDAAPFRIRGGTLWDGRTLHELYGEAYTPWAWQPRLKAIAEELGLHCFSTAFDASAVDFLEDVGVPAYKIASFELVDLPLIQRAARTGKPLIISTGLGTLDEIRDAVDSARGAGASQIALMKCASAYPAPAEAMNLRAIPHLAETFGVPVGLSDHTLGTAVSVASVALGACLIERHLTLLRADGGPDGAFSLEPDEFARMVRDVRDAERALGEVRYGVSEPERGSLVFRRSLFAVADIRRGEVLTAANVRSIRPGGGLPPKHLCDVLGARAARPISAGTPLSWELVASRLPSRRSGRGTQAPVGSMRTQPRGAGTVRRAGR